MNRTPCPRIPTPPRAPRVGDDAYNAHTGFYLGPVASVASDGSAVVITERNRGEPPHKTERQASRLTFCEPVAAQIARLRA